MCSCWRSGLSDASENLTNLAHGLAVGLGRFSPHRLFITENQQIFDTVGTTLAAGFLAANVLSLGRGGQASKLEEAAGRQLTKRFNVLKGESVAPYAKMADWLAEAKDKSRGIVMEVFTGNNKSISQVREQLKNGVAYFRSRDITNVSLYVMVNSERAAQRVRKELKKVGEQTVKVIVGP